MISFTVVGPGPLGTFAAGYFRPSAPREFVPLVVGCPTEKAAFGEAGRLAKEQSARQTGAFIEHSARGTARGWYTDDMP